MRSVPLAWLLVCAAALLAGLLAHGQPGWLRAADAAWQDRWIQLAARQPAPAEPVLVQIDEKSLQHFGSWPWPRPLLAELAERLRQHGARLQVWDLLLPESAQGDAALSAQLVRGDIVLAQALALDPDIVEPPSVGRLLGDDAGDGVPCSQSASPKGYLGVAETLAARHAGHVNATPDADGRLRRLPAVVCADAAGGRVRYPQLALAAAAADEPDGRWSVVPGDGPLQPSRWLQRGRWRFALDEQGWIPIPYQRHHTAWPALSAYQVLMAERASSAQSPLQGRVVLLGATALGVGDIVATPLHSSAPGVSVHAEVIAQALAAGKPAWPGAAPKERGWLAAALALLAALPVGGAVSRLLGQPRAALEAVTVAEVSRGASHQVLALTVSALLALGLPVLASWAAYALWGQAWPTVAPVLAVLAMLVAAVGVLLHGQRRQVARLAAALQSFVPAPLARQIAQQSLQVGSLGCPQEGYLLAVHIQGLHPWVSRADSLQALALVHALHATVQRIGHAHGGSMEHAQGGRFYLGWPQARADAAEAALDCAQALYAELTRLLAANEQPERPLSAWMALECGSYLLGLVGTPDGRRSVLLGPAANDVSAMLDLAPELASPLLLGPRAARALQATPGGAADLRPLGIFQLPDGAAPQTLWWCAV